MARPPGRPPGSESPPVEIVWEAPPNPREQPSIYNDAMQEVKARPGAWARLRVWPTQSPAYNAKKGIQRTQKDPRWEASVGRIRGENGAPDQYGLYVRYRTPEQMEAVKK